MKLDNFTAWVQAVLSGIYLACTFFVIIIYELGLAKLATQSQEKTFDSMVNWMTGGALIVLYFWLQRAKAVSPADLTHTSSTTTTTPKGDLNAISETTTVVDNHPGAAGER